MDISQDERIGANIATYRNGRSQEWLADQMRDRGHDKWSQSTVWAVEKGKRPLRLTEASDLAQILGLYFVGDLLRTSAETDLAQELEAVFGATKDLQRAAAAYSKQRDALNRKCLSIELTASHDPDASNPHETLRQSSVFSQAKHILAEGLVDLVLTDHLGLIRRVAQDLGKVQGERRTPTVDQRAAVEVALADDLVREGMASVMGDHSPVGRYVCANGHRRFFTVPAGRDLPQQLACRTCDAQAELNLTANTDG